LIVAAAALSAASRSKSVYDATAKVLIRRVGATALTTSWTPFLGLEEEMNTEVEIIHSEPVLQRAVDILKERDVSVSETVKKHRTTRPPTVRDIASGVSADPMERSNIMVIKFRGSDPKFVGEAANAVAEAYVEDRVQVRKTAGLEDYFSEQISALENRLLDLSETEQRMRIEGRVFDLEWQQRNTLGRANEILLKLNETRSRRVAEEAEIAATDERMKRNPDELWPFPPDSDDNLMASMRDEYWVLRRDRDAAATQFTPSNPQVKMMDDRLTKMEGRFRDEAHRRIREKQYTVQNLKAYEAAYEQEIAKISGEMVLNPEVIARISYLQKQIQYTYLHYDKVLGKMLETMASEANDIRLSNAKILSAAQVRLTKAGQMQTVYVVFSILLGITLGIGFGFLLENLDHSVKSASDVEDVVGVPLLGSIPDTKRVSETKGRIKNTFDRNSE
jgi:uncharacterized protein involved in exopolysaccharide biosynthesis